MPLLRAKKHLAPDKEKSYAKGAKAGQEPMEKLKNSQILGLSKPDLGSQRATEQPT